MDAKLLERVRRIYSAIGAVEERDPKKLKATVIETKMIRGVFQDFRGGLTDEEMSNYAHMLIHNIANLRDHLRGWAAHHGKDKARVDDTIKASIALQIIADLSNNDKHPYPPRDGGHSRRSPRLVEIRRVMQLKTQAKKGSTVGMTLGPGGVPRLLGDGTAKAVITGDVLDKDGKPMGDLYDTACKAVEAWEGLLGDFGIGPPASGK